MKLTPANDLVRSRNVTASEVGALMGEHPYTTPGRIFDRLTGADQMTLPNLAMEFGSDSEPVLARYAQRMLRGAMAFNVPPVTVRLNARTFEHPRVRLCATPDAYVLGTDLLVELKLSFSQNRWRDGAGRPGLPPDIEWQARAQLACTHRKRVIVYVFTGTEHVYIVDRHRGKERAMTQAVERFWRDHIDTGIRPSDPAPPEIVYWRAS
jgi:hypothetical protein